MKLVASIYNMEELDSLKNYADAILIDYPLIHLENIHEILKIGLTPILKFNQMVHPFETEKYKSFFLTYKDIDCLYYVTDLGLAHMLKTMHLIHKTIYDPVTMITNSLDAKAYKEYGFEAIGISNEITLKDLNIIHAASEASIFYQVFGYRQMLQSRRKLISLYLEKIEKELPLEHLFIEEITRNEIYPIIENEQGTHIYRSYLISLLEEISNLPLKYAFLDSFLIDQSKYLESLKLFSEVLKGKDIQIAKKEFDLLELNIQEGFAYKDSIYMKEEF